MPIQKVYARQIFDSRGNPTVEVDVTTDLGLFRAAVPSGASTGIYEALELRDNDKSSYHGKSVFKAIANVNNTIAEKLIAQNFEVTQQTEIDDFLLKLDGTPTKSNLGANAILGVSLAIAKAAAAKKGVPLYRHLADLAGNKNIVLPVPAFNVINGGSHAGNKLAMQEFMILPTGAASFTEAMKIGSEVYHHLKAVIKKKYGLDATCVGDEGGFAPNILSNKEALELIKQSIELAGYTGKVEIGMDVAASEFFKENQYDLDFKNPNSDKSQWLEPSKLADLYREFIKEYPIVSIEDPFDQDDWSAWSNLTGSVSIPLLETILRLHSYTYSNCCRKESLQLFAFESESNRNRHGINSSSFAGQV
uniref:Enolase n=1 Tax=Glycyphagus domesticus TaxID=105145 RepID=Q1M2L9_GLYDO|nr:Gly d enolase-like protein [Glycyphagus domesticus]